MNQFLSHQSCIIITILCLLVYGLRTAHAQTFQDIGICGFIDGIIHENMFLNDTIRTSESVWNCNKNGIMNSNPCGNETLPSWPGITCDEELYVSSISLDNIGLNGK